MTSAASPSKKYNWRPGPLGRSTAFTTVGLGARAAIQAVYLILLSRYLGPSGYGMFSGCLAVGVLLSPLAGWGFQTIIIRELAIDRSNPVSWVLKGLSRLLSTGVVFVLIALGFAVYAMSTRLNLQAMLLLAISEIVLLPAAQLISGSFLALGQSASAAFNFCVVPACRMIGAIVFVASGVSSDPNAFSFIHFGTTLIGAVIALLLFASANGWLSRTSASSINGSARGGTGYALGSFIATGYTEIDKVLLLQILGSTVVGNYTTAFRVMTVLTMPLYALVTAALPKLFELTDFHRKTRLLKRAVLVTLGYSLIATAVAVASAPFMPTIFGAGFTNATKYLWMLSPWIVLYGVHQCFATGLTVYDKQIARVLIEAVGMAIVVAFNILFLPPWGVNAAAAALLIAEGFMAMGCWLLVRRLVEQAPVEAAAQ
jgi:O-antigen/teichoic acid export membrane protein